MIQINNSRLRSIELKDLPFIKDIRTSEDVQSSVGQRIFLNDEEQYNWYKNIINNKKVLYAVFEVKNLDEWVKYGYVRITEIDHFNKSMMIGADLHQDNRSKGWGKIVYKLLLELGFKHWGMNRLYLLVLESNTIARALYDKIGLKTEGIQRKAVYKNSKYEDYIMMSILREEFNDTVI
jgi:RimJ/RimL family protein N-acetyltransferase